MFASPPCSSHLTSPLLTSPLLSSPLLSSNLLSSPLTCSPLLSSNLLFLALRTPTLTHARPHHHPPARTHTHTHTHTHSHQYFKREQLSPFASIAFNPIDGMMQAAPHVLATLVLPTNVYVHLGMFFFTAIWATYIHDAVDGDTDPVMGSRYHTKHHTHLACNYGQFFTFCDSFWGTLWLPGDDGKKKGRAAAAAVTKAE